MPPQDPSMQTAPDPRAELDRLRKIKRLRELEAKAGGQVAAPAGPSLRSETDAIIEEAAAAIPGGYEAFNRKPADPQRMAAMGYVQDPLAKSGYAKPAAPEAPIVDSGNQNNLFTDAMRLAEAPVAGLTGGGLTGWAKTTSQDPVLGATQAVDFISPVDDAARAYQGLKQAGAGLIDGDMQKAAEGAQQFAIDGSFTAMQALPGSMTLRGVTGVATPGRNTLALNMADLERSAVQATRAPPVRKAPPAPVAPVTAPKPFSAPAEPAGGGLVRRNLDRIAGGAVGATIGGAGDAYAAPGDGNGDGSGPLNAGTGAAIGFFGPRAVASAASRGFRAAARPFRPAGFDERVAAKAVRDALKSGGIRTPEEAAAAFTARFGDKPASVADLTQEGVSTAAGLSRREGATGEAARARGEELLGNRAGRLERDIAQANPNLNPATITGDVDRMVALAQQQATPAYNALRQGYPLGSLTSPRLEQLSAIDALAPHIKAVNDYRATTAATEGRVVGDFEYWDLVKRDIDAKEQQLIAAGATMDDIRLRKLEDTRNALVEELDTLVPDYPAARQLGGEAPKMREAMRQGERILGQYQTSEEVARLVAGVTGQSQLTALQAGVIRSMVKKTEGATGAMAALMSTGSRRKLSEVFGPEAAEALQARFAADAAIVNNATRMNPNIGSVTSQAQMGGGGVLPIAAEAIRAFRSPIEATLAAVSKGGAYSKSQRDLMGQMLLEGATPENLARIFGNRGGRGGRPAPPALQGPPTGGGAGPARGPTVPPAPTGAAPRARPAPSEEAVLSAMAQVTKPAPGKARAPIGPPTRDTIWDGPVPTKPQSLRGWIRSQGGINDRNYMTGDMKAVMGRANGMPGLINRESGTGLDELARKAYQEGFDVDPEDANSLMRLLEEEFGGSPSYRIGAKEEWDAYQDTLRARRGNVPGQTSSSPPMIGGAAFGALTSGGATYAATGDEDLALKAGLLGGIGGGVLGNRLAKGSRPKAPPSAKAGAWKRDPATLGLGTQDYLAYINAKHPPASPDMTPPYFIAASAVKRLGGNRQAAAAELADYAAYLKQRNAKPEVVANAERAAKAVADVDPMFFDDAAFNARMKSEITAGGEGAMAAVRGSTPDDGISGTIRADRGDTLPGERPIRRGPPGKPPPVKNGIRGNAEAIGAGTGAVFATDVDGDGEVSFGERAGAAITGGVIGNVARRSGAPRPKGPVGSKFRGPSQQTFAGVNAKTADRAALGRAQNMEAEGASRDAIWDETGWFKGVDGKWRFEIDDSKSVFNDMWLPRNPTRMEAAKKRFVETTGLPPIKFMNPMHADETSEAFRWVDAQPPSIEAVRQSTVLGHRNLYEAYPQVADTYIGSEPRMDLLGRFDDKNNVLTVGGGGRPLTQTDEAYRNQMHSTALHENQHNIQSAEGFARGGHVSKANRAELLSALERERDLPIGKKNRPATELASEYDKISDEISPYYAADYILGLQRIAMRDNPTPREVTRYSEWYSVGNDLYRDRGRMPRRKGEPRRQWISEGATRLRDKYVADFAKRRGDDALQKAMELVRQANGTDNPNVVRNGIRRLQAAMDRTIEGKRHLHGIESRRRDLESVDDDEIYRRLAGEVEARNVQTRDEMRRRGEQPGRPWETQDRSDDQQIVRFGSGKAESRPKPPAPRNAIKGPPRKPAPPKKAEEVALINALKKARAAETATRRRNVMRDNRDELNRVAEEAVMQAERDLLEYRDRQFRQAANTARWMDRGAAAANVGKKAAVATGNQIKKTMMKNDAELLKTYGVAVGGIAGIALGARALAGPDGDDEKKKEILAPTDKRYFVETKLKKRPEMLGPVQNALVELGMLDIIDADTKWGTKTRDAIEAYLSRKPDRLPNLPIQDYEVPALMAEAYGGYQDEKGKWFYNTGEPIVYPPKRGDTYLPARPLRPDEARRMAYDKRTEAERKK